MSTDLLKNSTFWRGLARGRGEFAGDSGILCKNGVYRESFVFQQNVGQKVPILRKQHASFHSFTVLGKGNVSEWSDSCGGKSPSTKLAICVFLRGGQGGGPQNIAGDIPPGKRQSTMELAICLRPGAARGRLAPLGGGMGVKKVVIV